MALKLLGAQALLAVTSENGIQGRIPFLRRVFPVAHHSRRVAELSATPAMRAAVRQWCATQTPE